ncbi:hypothetical protein SRHO_G00065770 [Serrasalmus rhombeus]
MTIQTHAHQIKITHSKTTQQITLVLAWLATPANTHTQPELFQRRQQQTIPTIPLFNQSGSELTWVCSPFIFPRKSVRRLPTFHPPQTFELAPCPESEIGEGGFHWFSRRGL